MCGESDTSPSPGFSRRTFLHKVGFTLGGAVLAAPGVAAAQECSPTLPDILGPFYRFGAPFGVKLGAPNEPGEKLAISGTVYSSDCRTGLSNALIEVWQANSAGLYDTDIPGHFTEATTYHLRGMFYTDERGRYEFETVMPGSYPIPPGMLGAGQMRPAHIHFRVMETLHISLTTQLYFQGDPYIGKDPFASRKPTLAIKLKQDSRQLRGVFDIVLAT